MREVEHLPPAVPRRQPEKRIGADHQGQRALRRLGAQLLERSARCSSCRARRISRLSMPSAGNSVDREPQHREAIGRAGARRRAVRRIARRHEPHLGGAERAPHVVGEAQVAVVDRVERAAEQRERTLRGRAHRTGAGPATSASAWSISASSVRSVSSLITCAVAQRRAAPPARRRAPPAAGRARVAATPSRTARRSAVRRVPRHARLVVGDQPSRERDLLGTRELRAARWRSRRHRRPARSRSRATRSSLRRGAVARAGRARGSATGSESPLMPSVSTIVVAARKMIRSRARERRRHAAVTVGHRQRRRHRHRAAHPRPADQEHAARIAPAPRARAIAAEQDAAAGTCPDRPTRCARR